MNAVTAPETNYRAVVEYDGADYSGFQWQHNTRTIQGELERALQTRMGQPLRIAGAGRTDAGVHALGQVISFRCCSRIPLENMVHALNSALPHDMAIRSVQQAPEGFHARFSASSRVYVYLILNSAVRSALLRRYSTLAVKTLDVSAMQDAALHLLGERNFASFANELEPGQTPWREMMRLNVRAFGPLILVRIEANAFLKGMVRCIAGTLMEVGNGKRTPASIQDVLNAEDRRLAGPTAPAQGLCLVKVRYGERRQRTAHKIKTGG